MYTQKAFLNDIASLKEEIVTAQEFINRARAEHSDNVLFQIQLNAKQSILNDQKRMVEQVERTYQTRLAS